MHTVSRAGPLPASCYPGKPCMHHPLLSAGSARADPGAQSSALRDFFLPHHPAAAAELLDDLAPEEALYVLELLAGRMRAEVFSYLTELQDGIAQLMDRNALATLVSAMSHDERADLITRLPEGRTQQIMPLFAQAEREDIRRLTAYTEHTAGSVMTSDYATVPAELTAAAAIDRLRHEAPIARRFTTATCSNDHRRLVGFVSLKNLILAPPHRRVADIMQRKVISSLVDEDQEITAKKLMEYDLLALPILDHEGRLVGIVTHDDVADVIVEEATEDVYRLGAVAPLEDGYLRTPWSRCGANAASGWPSCSAATHDHDGPAAIQGHVRCGARTGAVHSLDHLGRGQLRFAIGNDHHAHLGTGRSESVRLVSHRVARDHDGSLARADAGGLGAGRRGGIPAHTGGARRIGEPKSRWRIWPWSWRWGWPRSWCVATWSAQRSPWCSSGWGLDPSADVQSRGGQPGGRHRHSGLFRHCRGLFDVNAR